MLTLTQLRRVERRKLTYELSRDYCPSGNYVNREYNRDINLEEVPNDEKQKRNLEDRVENTF